MNSLNKSLPNISRHEQTEGNLNRSFDLRHILERNPEKSPESSRLQEKSHNRKVYFPKRKHDDNDTPNLKRSRSNSMSVTAPMYRHYQLLGDSQLLRFAEQLLSYNDSVSFTEDTGNRRIGYCVSGQKIKDLKERLELEEFPIYPHVILLIGTNDLIQGTDLHNMCINYERILEILKLKCKELILLTVPPIARFETQKRHWFILQSFNEFIQKAADDSQTFALDLCSMFISYNNSISKTYFESYFKGMSPRPDLIHLNQKGFLVLRNILDIFFDTDKNTKG